MLYVSTNKIPAELFLNRKLHTHLLLQKQNKNQTNNTKSN